jgi:peptidoglycan/xylan/chitin deacetylase (PgdA/CDA1 family)
MFLEKRSPDVIYSVDTQEAMVALTIDDGPDPETTAEILNVLRANDARATFFLLSDNIDGNEALVEQILAEGHEIGNHLTTQRPSILYSKSEFESHLLEAHEALSRFTKVRWFRPGSGWYNNAMLSTLAKHEYQCVLGSVYPFDAAFPSSQFASMYVLWRVKPGAIIVLHDSEGRGERTVQTLNTILPELIEQGFQVTTLSELVGHPE